MVRSVTSPDVDQLSNNHIGNDATDDALLNVVRQLRPVSFRYKDNSESKHSRYGFVAQELEALLPAVVQADPISGLRYISYTDVLALLVLGAQHTEALVTKVHLDLNSIEERLAEDAVLVDPRLSALERALVDIIAAGATVRSVRSIHISENFAEPRDANLSLSASPNNLVWNSTAQRADVNDLIAELETLASSSPNHHSRSE